MKTYIFTARVGLAIVCAMLLLAACNTNDGGSGLTDDSFTFALISGDTAYEVSKGIGTPDSDLIIPANYNGKPVTHIADDAFRACTGLSSVTIPSGVTSIGDNAFWGCSSLSSITIPASVSSIGERVFVGCDGIDSITVEPANANYSAVEGVLFNKDQTILHTCPPGKTADTYTVPAGVLTFVMGAFHGCENINNVVLPDGLASIGFSAFAGCGSMESINVPASVTSIGRVAFYGCSSLENIFIPSGVSSMGEYAFYSCTSLSIYCAAAAEPAGWEANWNPHSQPVTWNSSGAP